MWRARCRAEVPGYLQEQLTQTLIVRLLENALVFVAPKIGGALAPPLHPPAFALNVFLPDQIPADEIRISSTLLSNPGFKKI